MIRSASFALLGRGSTALRNRIGVSAAQQLRHMSAPTKPREYKTDGANLTAVTKALWRERYVK